jgi:Ca2+-transporting ATPase
MKHPLPIDRVRGLVASDLGLRTDEVADRRVRYGVNDIVETARNPAAELARETARDPMIWFLIGTASLYLVLAQYAEAITLLVSCVPLIGMDVYLHRRTQASTRALRGHLASTARVIRDGREIEIPAIDVVVGDLAVVSAGDSFPADGVIVDGRELQVDESALTGEAYPVAKHVLEREPTADDAQVDAEHWGFAGTRMLVGRGRLRVVTIGDETLYGAIVALATGAVRERTPLQRAVASLVNALIASAVILCVLLAIVRLREGHGWIDALVSAASLAIAALPEEFPIVVAVFLGVGVYRLARRKALVSRALAVENIGRVTTICSDKTGTITEGRLRVATVIGAAGRDRADVLAVARAAARLETGDLLDRAIIEAAGGELDARDAIATFPFTEDRRRETVVIGGDVAVAHTKGAPETVLAMCREDDRAAWIERTAELAAAGYKVIACASRPLVEYAGGEPDRDFELAGLIAVADPLRAGVASAVAWCRDAGIRVVILTGDHPATARAVAIEMGLATEPVVITGERIAGSTDVAAALRGVDVVARAMPSHKLAIVRALRADGEIVAVTGDGVNDVPALQAADVGIAMGGKSARGARDVSSIVLLDDNFGSIVAAIGEGRTLFDNLRLSFHYLLAIHLPLVLSATFLPLAGYPVPYLPIHIVWIEAIIHPTALLAFQHARATATATTRGRGADVRLFSRSEWAIIAGSGLAVAGLVALVFIRNVDATADHARGAAMAVLATTSACLTAALGALRTRAAQIVVASTLASAVVFVHVPALSTLFHVGPLGPVEWTIAALAGALAALPVLAYRTLRR